MGVPTVRPAVVRGAIAAFAAFFLLASFGAGTARAEPPIPEPRPYAFTIYGGQIYSSNFSETFYKPGSIDFEDSGMVALAFSARLLDFDWGLSFEVEGNVARRFGNENFWEFNAALVARWSNFPWNDFVYTTIGIPFFGPSYSTEISEVQRQKNGGDGSKWLNFFAPEITFSPPDNPNIALVIRFHHNSGVFGLYNGVTSGSSALTAGLRFRFAP